METLQKLINKCVKTNNAFHRAQAQLNDYCITHYGTTPSDVDCDFIIDTCLGGAGATTAITAEEFEEEFQNAIKLKG